MTGDGVGDVAAGLGDVLQVLAHDVDGGTADAHGVALALVPDGAFVSRVGVP